MSEKPLASVGAIAAPMQELMPLIEERLLAGQCVRIYPRGVSMRPLIREGKDSVTLSAIQGKLTKNGIVLFRVGEHYVLHRFIGVRQGGYVFCGDHRYVYESGITPENVVALVTAIQRNGKDVRMDSLVYRVYVRLIFGRRRLRQLILRVIRKLQRIFCHQK